MNHIITRLICGCGLFLCLAGVVRAETPVAEYKKEVKVTTLLHTSVTSTGQPIEYPKTGKPLITTVLVEIPPGVETGWHIHRLPCVAYVLEGTITVEVKGGKTFTYKAGQAIAETLNTPHNGRNLGTKTVKIIMTVIGEQGVPIAEHLNKK